MQLFTFRKEIKIKDTFYWTTTKSIQLGDDLTGTELQKKKSKKFQSTISVNSISSNSIR